MNKANKNYYTMSAEAMNISLMLDDMFRVPKDGQEERKGLHASAILSSDTQFCVREQVLSMYYKRKDEANKFAIDTIRVFEEGNYIHEKWQTLFKRAGVAKSIEGRGYSKLFDLYLTPDAIISVGGELYVVEIKSSRTEAFRTMKNAHPSGTNQLQLYMHFFCIPRGFVLVEDKNDQSIKVFPVSYEPGQAKKYIERLYEIKEAKNRFEATGNTLIL